MPFTPGPYSRVAMASALGIGVFYGTVKFGIAKELEETRAMNIAQAEKTGDYVLHTLEYGWNKEVKLIPRFIRREKTDAPKLAKSKPAPKLAPAPGVDSPTAGGPAEATKPHKEEPSAHH